jgi:hypothetical protein
MADRPRSGPTEARAPMKQFPKNSEVVVDDSATHWRAFVENAIERVAESFVVDVNVHVVLVQKVTYYDHGFFMILAL